MNEEHAANLMEIGATLGVYTVVNMLLEGIGLSDSQLQEISDLAAKEIQELSGMPAEDFTLMAQPIITKLTKQSKEKK